MVKILKKKESAKVPVLRLVQGLVVGVLCFYAFFLLYRPSANENVTGNPSQTSERKATEAQSSQISRNAKGGDATTIAYAVSITGCGSDPLEEGAAVLEYSIRLASIHGNMGGRYDYKMYAIYHPQAEACAKTLAPLGYELLKRETPVKVSDIEGEFLRSKIEKNGCCGEKELIKLEAYTLTDHAVVVHLDLDVLVLKPLDPLFDAMIKGKSSSYDPTQFIKVQWPQKPFPEKVDAFITRDYNMHHPSRKYAPAQGGFLVVRPDMDVYNEYVEIVKKGDFRSGGGWGGQVGSFYGGMTIQGLVPYFYDILHPDTFVELNHCEWNQMCINPRDKPTVNDVVNGNCRTGEEDCEDCRSLPLEKVYTTHYTLCQKPWTCTSHDVDRIQARLCRKLHHEWYRVRSEMEKSWGRTGIGPSAPWQQKDHFYGFCKGAGAKGYIAIAKPYGGAAMYSDSQR